MEVRNLNKEVFALLLLTIFFTARGAELTPPGEWRDFAVETTYIQCLDGSIDLENERCQVSKDGPIYQLYCPSLGKQKVGLKQMNLQLFCYAQRQECTDPKPCHILEKVVHQKGGDYCQHGEIKNDRSCLDGEVYRFDHIPLKKSGENIVDQCCRNREHFARPGLSI